MTETLKIEEPWLLGSIPGFDPVISHLLRGSQHIRMDVDGWFGALPNDELWATEAGFHLKHLAGSTGRLCTYLALEALSDEQAAEIPQERERSPDLVRLVHLSFDRYETLVRVVPPDQFGKLRYIGRLRVPVTAISLAIHIIEHGQRHVGQAISSWKSGRRV